MKINIIKTKTTLKPKNLKSTKKDLEKKTGVLEKKAKPIVEAREQKPHLFWKKISKGAIYLLVFLLPLFFLPWTNNILDFNKQILLISLTLISLFSWLLDSLSEGKISLNFNFFHIAVFIFLIILGLSNFFSSYRYGSFWGLPLSIAGSFLSSFFLILLYFLIVNVFQNKKEIFRLVLVLIASSVLASLIGIIYAFGKFILPFDFAKISSFNTIGTIRSLGIFAGCLLSLIVFLILTSKRLKRYLLILAALPILCFVFIINFWAVWVSVLVGMALILVFGIAKKGIFSPVWLNLVMALFVIALFFSFFRISIPFLPPVISEVFPSQKVSFDIAIQTLKEFNPPLSLFFGSGPGTFVYDYSRFRPETINRTNFWNIRFGSSSSEIFDKLATTGLLGLFSFFGILGTMVYLMLKQLTKKEEGLKGENTIFCCGIFVSWFSLAAASFLYSFNLSLLFLFWVLTALFIALRERKLKTWTLEPSSLASVGVSFLFILTLVLGLGLIFIASQRYAAEVKYYKGLKAFEIGEIDKAINNLSNAADLTGKKQDNYLRDLSQLYISKINDELKAPGFSQEQLLQRVTPLVVNVVNTAKRASDISPKNVANWTIRGFAYGQLTSLISGTDAWAIKSYEEAVKLEPANPFIWNELGRVYLAQDNLEKAKEQFEKAIALKADYAPAHFQMALLYQKEGRIKEAIEKLEMTKQITGPSDISAAFQLGILYYNIDEFDKAKFELEMVVVQSPNNSNARYLLGLIYDKEGAKNKAIEQFEVVARFNPENTEVRKILANLRAGEEALKGIVPSEPPIEETPPERIED